MGMSPEKFTIREPEIVAPQDFNFQLNHYVICPEVREGEKLINVLRLKDNRLVLVKTRQTGTVDKPILEVVVQSNSWLNPSDLSDIKDKVIWRYCLSEDLKPFYKIAKQDKILQASISMHYGAKDKATPTMFEALLSCVCAQNTSFRRVYDMMQSLCFKFGDKFVFEGKTWYAFPRPPQLAAAPLAEIQACKVGYRASYIKRIAESVASDELDVEKVKLLPPDEAKMELMKLHGVGPYTADLALIIGARRLDLLHMDIFVREILWTFYFGGKRVSDDELRKFTLKHFDGYQAYAGLYLTTNTEKWANTLGKEFHLKSWARL